MADVPIGILTDAVEVDGRILPAGTIISSCRMCNTIHGYNANDGYCYQCGLPCGTAIEEFADSKNRIMVAMLKDSGCLDTSQFPEMDARLGLPKRHVLAITGAFTIG